MPQRHEGVGLQEVEAAGGRPTSSPEAPRSWGPRSSTCHWRPIAGSPACPVGCPGACSRACPAPAPSGRRWPCCS
eukprot:380367-Alexandrium_andersonii.AAC.1